MRAHEEYKKIDLPWLEEIPAHWKVQRAKNLFKVINERSEEGKEELLSVSSNHGVVKRNDANVTMFQAESYEGYKLCWPEDLVINSLWAWQNGLGFSNFYGIVSTAYSVYRLNTPSNNYRFFDYLLRSSAFHWELRTRSKGIWKSRYILSDEDFLNSPIICPPREEQDAIVRFLDAKCAKIDRLIKLKERQIELLNEKKQNIINQAVSKGLDPHAPIKDSGVDYIGVIPASWTVVPIHSVASVGNGSTPLRANTSFWHNGIFPWLNSGSVGDEIITQSEEFVTPLALSKCHLPIVKKDSLVMALTGQGKTRGKVAILEIEATINQHLAYITPNGKSVEIRFLKYVLDSMYGYIRLISDGNGSTKGGLTCFQIKHLKIALPSLKEQRDIVSQLDRINENIKNQINQAQRFIRLINEFKASFISDVVTGKINITDN